MRIGIATAQMGKRIFNLRLGMKANCISAVVIFLLFCAIPFRHFLTGNWLFSHDSLFAMPSSHLLFEALFHGRLPLWSPYQNFGDPIWLSIEAMQAWDPIAIVFYAIAFIFDQHSLLAYQ